MADFGFQESTPNFGLGFLIIYEKTGGFKIPNCGFGLPSLLYTHKQSLIIYTLYTLYKAYKNRHAAFRYFYIIYLNVNNTDN